MENACEHCRSPLGEEACQDENERHFCCPGCRGAWQLIRGAGLFDVHAAALSSDQGLARANQAVMDMGWVDDPGILNALSLAVTEEFRLVELVIPAIHCAACILLLENLPRLHPEVIAARVDFGRQRLRLRLPQSKALAPVMGGLARIGYPPDLSRSLGGKSLPESKGLGLYIGLSFFAFGNIMLLAFPDYFSSEIEPAIQSFLHTLQALLALISIYCAFQIFLPSLPRSLRTRQIDMDVPVSIGILVIILISYWHLYLGKPAFFDSLSGLIFFLIAGRAFQRRTWEHLNFEQNWQDFLPLAITRVDASGDQIIPIHQLRAQDTIRLMPEEILPADARVLEGEALMDLSFITGESDQITIQQGHDVLAGSRLKGTSVLLSLNKTPSTSYLASLWRKPQTRDHKSLQNRLSRNFSLAILILGLIGFLYWLPHGLEKAVLVLASIFIVACPCALALSVPLALAHGMRALARFGFWLSEPSVVEKLAGIDTLVLDKTGTLTSALGLKAILPEKWPEADQILRLRSLISHSTHPISRCLLRNLPKGDTLPIRNFAELQGVGLQGEISGIFVQLIRADNTSTQLVGHTAYYENQQLVWEFSVEPDLRPGVLQALHQWKKRFSLHLLTGDSFIPPTLTGIFGQQAHARVLPDQKYAKVTELEKNRAKVLMIGDGMNDSGALRAATVGLSIVEGSSKIFPSSDGMLASESLPLLERGMQLAQGHIVIAHASILLSLIYNFFGLMFAFTGRLEPVVCAVLMPASSLSVAIVSIISSWVLIWREKRLCRLCFS